MNIEEEDAACEALIQWFRSQDLAPDESVMIMAKAMCTAVINMVVFEPSPLLKTDDQKRQAVAEGIAACAETVREMFEEIKEGR
jgi:hypothetical protein